MPLRSSSPRENPHNCFTISEQELIAHAIAEGRYTWDSIDINTLGEPIVGTTITY